MHRIDTATAQQDKFGQGKNGFTNGDPATGRRATDLNSDMWDAVQEEICGVIEGAGIQLVKTQYNQLYLAIKKIITGEIPDALIRKNNLSDVTDKSIARKNLELKSAAQADITTSNRDATYGRVLKAHDYGIGRTIGGVTTGIDFKNYAFIQGEHLFVNMNTCSNIPTGLTATSYYFIFVNGLRDMDGSPSLILVNYSNPSEIWFAYGAGAVGSRTWTTVRLYNTSYKPSAADVGAVPTSRTVNGHALTGNINVTSQDIFNTQSINIGASQNLDNYQTPGIYCQAANANTSAALNYPENLAGTLLVLKNAGVTQVYYVYNSSRIWTRSKYATGAWTAWAREYNTLNKPSAADVGALPSGGTAVAATKLATKRTINGVGFDGTANITISASAIGSYTKAESDARYQLKNTASKAANGWYKDTSTGLIIQWQKINTTTASDNSFTFPIAFPNANFGCVGTVMDQTNADAGVRTVKIASRTKTGFNCTVVNGSAHMATPVFIYSVGY